MTDRRPDRLFLLLRSRSGYTTRLMAAVAASLLLLILTFNLPFSTPPERIGWRAPQASERLLMEEMTLEKRPLEEAGVPVTVFGKEEMEEAEVGEEEQVAELDEPVPEPVEPPPTQPVKMAVRQQIYDYTEQMPAIEGGLGAYYIHIEYPPEAIEEGIEGRLMLNFVVETNGRPSDIEVMQTLHPLCDSAAVRALRKTHFVPGRQNGKLVRVRMRLPVRFQLVIEGEKRADVEKVDTGG